MSQIFNNIGKKRDDQEIVLLKDDRKKVQDTTRPPFRWICSLEVEFPEPVLYPLGTLEHPGKAWKDLAPARNGCGSGLMITPNHVLTASHVLAGLKVVKIGGVERFQLVRAKRVTIIPGRNEEHTKNPRPFGTFSSQRILVNPGFQKLLEVPVAQLTKAQVRKALGQDFGVVQVAENASGRIPGQTAGWWRELTGYQLQAVDDAFRRKLQHANVHIGGYPGEKARISCSVQWYSSDKVVEAFPKAGGRLENLLFYQADTSAGMSGSPVWVQGRDGRCFLVGVHSSFLEYKGKGLVNVGALFTAVTIRQLSVWGIESLEILFIN